MFSLTEGYVNKTDNLFESKYENQLLINLTSYYAALITDEQETEKVVVIVLESWVVVLKR